MESCFGWRVGNVEDMAAGVCSGGGCAWGGASEDGDIMRGISDLRGYMLQSTYFKGAVPEKRVVDSPQPYVP